jgi:hypothetical protein
MIHKVIPCLLVAALLLLAGSALAQSSPNYRLEWSSVSGAGQPASSAHYIVQGTMEWGAGGAPAASSGYQVYGGFWPAFLSPYSVYLPVVVRGSQ